MSNQNDQRRARRRWVLVAPVQFAACELASERAAWDLVAVDPVTRRPRKRVHARTRG